MDRISVQEVDFDVGLEIARLSNGDTNIGAIASFVGLVRGGDVNAITLEHYSGMTEKAIHEIVSTARNRWVLNRICVIHRIGQLSTGANIVFVGVSAGHRGEAFAACELIMDYLKTRAPFWKKESIGDENLWVAAKETDELAAQRWNLS